MLKSGEETLPDEKWSPSITVGTPVLIPDHYVADLPLRLSLYRRLADLETPEDIDRFGAELIDRFGKLPEEVEHLLKIVFVKQLCLRANVEKVDAGPKGVVLSFRANHFANPPGLVRYIAEQGALAKIRPDQKIVLAREWPKPLDRLKGVAVILTQLARMAEGKDDKASVNATALAAATGQAAKPSAHGGKETSGAAGQGARATPATQKLNLTPTPPPPPPAAKPMGRYPALSTIRRSGPRKWVK
jgi:transcription-repair coupling factor (superfamily II helicase)